MTIETTRAPEGAKHASTGANRVTSAPTRPGAAGDAGASGGFAGLMSLLSASDAPAEAVGASLSGADAPLVVPDVTEDKEQNVPLALDLQALIAPNLIPDAPSTASTALTTPTTPVDAAARSVSASAPLATQLASKSRVASDAKLDLGDAGSQPATGNTDVATLLGHRRASQSHAAVQAQVELRQASLQPGQQPALAALDASRAAPIVLSAAMLSSLADPRADRPATGQVRTGLEGALGGTVADRLGISPTYEVAAASATVAEGQVAETVSYWASNGVKSAKLTLDGLGDEPIEVQISVEGDQAQIDFRSNQPEVRQVLESASAQLKAMLSGQGLQLTGMSVGTSGQGGAQDNGRHQPKPGARQASLVSLEPARASSTRVANAAVGQALDLYV